MHRMRGDQALRQDRGGNGVLPNFVGELVLGLNREPAAPDGLTRAQTRAG
jgi:hypothetical protein